MNECFLSFSTYLAAKYHLYWQCRLCFGGAHPRVKSAIPRNTQFFGKI